MSLPSKEVRTVAEAEDWYQVYKVNRGYMRMQKILQWETDMDDVKEHYYEQNLDNNRFRSDTTATKKLDSNTTLKFEIKLFPRSDYEETDQGLFGLMNMNISAKLITKFPISSFLPDSLNKVLRKIWWSLVYREQWERWEEYAEERLRKFITDFRRFYNLEPPVARTKRVDYEPLF